MGRWEPNARGRLEGAALDLFLERGFERTTVGEIAGRAGLVERTFYRHFADKREVLFWGREIFADRVRAALAAAPAGLAPLDAMVVAIEAAAAALPSEPDHARRRHLVIKSTPELHERELLKTASLGETAMEGLLRRGAAPATARLCAEAGMTVFKAAYQRWLEGEGGRSCPQWVRQTFGELKDLFTAADGARPDARASVLAPNSGGGAGGAEE